MKIFGSCIHPTFDIKELLMNGFVNFNLKLFLNLKVYIKIYKKSKSARTFRESLKIIST